MGHTPDETPPHLAERWGGASARRDESRVARRLSRTPAVEGGYRLEAGAWRDDVFPFLQAIGVMSRREEAHGAAVQRELGPVGPYVGLDGLKTWCGIERLQAWPHVRCREAAWRPRVGFQAQPVRQGLGQRGVTTRPGERLPGPLGPDPWAQNLVHGPRRGQPSRVAAASTPCARARAEPRGPNAWSPRWWASPA